MDTQVLNGTPSTAKLDPGAVTARYSDRSGLDAALCFFTEANMAARHAKMLGRLLLDAALDSSASDEQQMSELIEQVVAVTTAMERFLDEVGVVATEGEDRLRRETRLN